MKKALIILIALFVLAGCGIFRSKEKTKTELDSVVNKSTESLLIDTSKRVILEHIKTVTVMPGIDFNKNIPLDFFPADYGSLVETFRLLNDAYQDMNLSVDSATNSVNLNIHHPGFTSTTSTDKKTFEQAGKSDKTNVQEDMKVHKKAVTVETKTKPDYAWIGYLAGLIVLLLIFTWLYRKFRLQ